jgi:membrane protein required for beta-lactamase induction
MTFLSLLLALLIDRGLWEADSARARLPLARYVLLLGSWLDIASLRRQPLLQLVALLPPILLVWVALGAIELLFGRWATAVAEAVILVLMLGPADLGRQATKYLEARDRGDVDSARQTAEDILGAAPPPDEPQCSFAVAARLLGQSLPRLFGPIFWFLVGGALAAVLYRAAAELSQLDAHADANTDTGDGLLGDEAADDDRPFSDLSDWLEWIPPRLAAASFALAGSFEKVVAAWSRHPTMAVAGGASRELVFRTGTAALDSYEDDLDDISHGWETQPVVEDAMALVWRALAAWVGLSALVAVLAWLA